MALVRVPPEFLDPTNALYWKHSKRMTTSRAFQNPFAYERIGPTETVAQEDTRMGLGGLFSQAFEAQRNGPLPQDIMSSRTQSSKSITNHARRPHAKAAERSLRRSPSSPAAPVVSLGLHGPSPDPALAGIGELHEAKYGNTTMEAMNTTMKKGGQTQTEAPLGPGTGARETKLPRSKSETKVGKGPKREGPGPKQSEGGVENRTGKAAGESRSLSAQGPPGMEKEKTKDEREPPETAPPAETQFERMKRLLAKDPLYKVHRFPTTMLTQSVGDRSSYNRACETVVMKSRDKNFMDKLKQMDESVKKSTEAMAGSSASVPGQMIPDAANQHQHKLRKAQGQGEIEAAANFIDDFKTSIALMRQGQVQVPARSG